MRLSFILMVAFLAWPNSLLAQAPSSDGLDMLNGPQAKEAQVAIEAGIETFKQRFLANAPSMSNSYAHS